MKSLPYHTESIRGIGGRVKKNPSDFHVSEQGTIEPNGTGSHLHLDVRTQNISSNGAKTELANFLNISPERIRMSGRKDSRAETVQRMSIKGIDADDLDEYDSDRVQTTPIGLHPDPLNRGNHNGNRFKIVIRGIEENAEIRAEKILNTLENGGMPNYYGRQRFGRRGNTAKLGEYLVKNKLEQFVHDLLGSPKQVDPPPVRAARTEFDEENYEKAINRWPQYRREHRNALAAYIDRGEPGPVLSALSHERRRLFVNAYQSKLFNKILAHRFDSFDSLIEGDVVYEHETGDTFVAYDPSEEEERANRGMISPTGPLYGYNDRLAVEKAGEIERKIITSHNIDASDFEKLRYLRCGGDRRSLRVFPEDLTLKTEALNGTYALIVKFSLPSGSYATVLLRELMKNGVQIADTEN